MQVEVHPSRFVPAPPADFWIVKSETRTVLMWEENQETWIKGYRIYRRVEGEAEFRPIGESRLPTFTDTDRTDGKAWYTVKAIGPIAESDAVTGVRSLPDTLSGMSERIAQITDERIRR